MMVESNSASPDDSFDTGLDGFANLLFIMY